ncbi:MAG: hypothetical protein M3Y54_08220 [Bacteroidota bacterium]|nr:hypothetical protein [Bacteroidota bacterium]
MSIGYDEVWRGEEFISPPNEPKAGFKVEPNGEFQEWVINTFSVEIPKTALKIVHHPAEIGDKDPEDEFCR